MNTCEHADKLSAYHDGELDAVSRAAMERHLGQCPQCAAELGRIRKLSALLVQIAPAEMSPLGMRRLHALAERSIGGDLVRWAMTMTALAASVLIACSVLLWRQHGSAASEASVPAWEMSVMQRPAESVAASSEDQLATWMVEDLSGKNGHDTKN